MSTRTLVKSAPKASTFKVWDKPTALAQVNDYIRQPFTPVVQVVEKNTLPNGKIWLVVKPKSGFYTEEWLIDPEPAELQHSSREEAKPQPLGFAGDSVSCQLKPNPEAVAEYESGYAHGLLDASYGSQPMCEEAECHYSAGYIDGFNSFRSSKSEPATNKRTSWSATYDSKWNWYWVSVGNRCVNRASTIEAAERMAQQYIATDELIQRQNAAVMMVYAR